jgi:SAM-dependent methyltransferase
MAIATESPSSLDIGCGRVKKCALGMDAVPGEGVDVVRALEDLPWPFADESFEWVNASQVFEHLRWTNDPEDQEILFRIFAEVHRILKPGGRFTIDVPHVESPQAFGIPAHCRFFTEDSFSFFAEPDRWPAWRRPLFRHLSLRVERVWRIGPMTHYHLREKAPTLYELLTILRIGRKGNIYAEFVK